MRIWNTFTISILSSLALGFSLFACSKSGTQGPPAAAVSVSKPITKEVTDYDEFTGHLESPQTVSLSARVSGIIMQAPFTEGSLVKAGDTLFVIDDRPFKADVASKESDVAKAQAQFEVADAQIKRYESVKGTKAISQQDYDQAVASAHQAQAQLKAARAALSVSHLNLEWTNVTAPIDGRAGRKLITVGNLVNGGAGQASLLTSITSVDPVYAYFNVPERSLLKYQSLTHEAKSNPANDKNITCSIQLENETGFSHDGTVDFIDNHIDPATGTIQMRGVIPNSNGALTPGLFVKLRVVGSKPYSTLLVPDAAIGSDQNVKFVLLIGNDNTVVSRPVKLGASFGKLRAISEGLTKDDVVIVNGLQYARPGTKVSPTEVTLGADGTIPSASTSSPTSPSTPSTEKK